MEVHTSLPLSTPLLGSALRLNEPDGPPGRSHLNLAWGCTYLQGRDKATTLFISISRLDELFLFLV